MTRSVRYYYTHTDGRFLYMYSFRKAEARDKALAAAKEDGAKHTHTGWLRGRGPFDAIAGKWAKLHGCTVAECK